MLGRLAQDFSAVQRPLSRCMRMARSPSISRSTNMNRSVHTVCGQAKPHHNAAEQDGDKKQTDRAQDQQAGDEVDFLRPDLDIEEIAARLP